MKIKFITLIIPIFTVIMAKADSPITSTYIYKAYPDNDMVVYARKNGMDKEVADYLHSSETKIDIKAAVINAIGWNINGTKNARAYSKYIFKKSMKDLDSSELTSDDFFCLGYLQVMDDYFYPSKAIPYIERAKELNPKSFTIAIINALIHGQNMMDNESNWCEIWNLVYKVFDDKSIIGDMNDDAKKIIWDYMVNYKCN